MNLSDNPDDCETQPSDNAPTRNTEISKAFDVLKQAMHEDQAYAWSWHCNLAMSAFDAGTPHDIANQGAVRFMQLAFGVDTSAFKEYKDLETQWNTKMTPPKVKLALCANLTDLPETFQKETQLSVTPLPESFWNTETFLVDRALCETDETLRQFIPYIVLKNAETGQVFTYSRGQGSEEARLRGNLSIGLGGHMDELAPEGMSLRTWCDMEAHRELKEEAGVTQMLNLEYVGLLCDPTNEVGRVHIGLLAIVTVTPDVISTLEHGVIEHGIWESPENLMTHSYERLENWSKAAVAHLV